MAGYSQRVPEPENIIGERYMVRLVVFDMDDTLYDEIDYCRSGFKACGRWLSDSCDLSAETIYNAFWARFASGDRRHVFDAALKKLNINIDDDLIKQLVEVYRQHTPDISLPHESRLVLDNLSSNYTLALLTDGFLPAQRLKVKALGIESYFKCIIFTEQLGRQFWKPSVVGFEKILAKTGFSAQQSVYIGDNAVKDFIGPNKLGFASIQIIRPNGVHTDSGADEISRPGHVLTSLKDLIELIEVI